MITLSGLQWVISGGVIHTPKLGRLINESEIKSAHTKIYVETLKEKTAERGFHYISRKITMVITLSHALGFLGFVDRPFSLEGFYIYTSECFWIKLQRSHLSEHLS